MKILDIGCGKGENCFYFSKKYPNAEVYGIDMSEKNIKEAKEAFPGINFNISRAEKVLFKKKFFDIVSCYEVLEHVENLEKTLSEIKRVLKKGGHFVVSVPFAKSEKKLLEENLDYWNQIGHKRFFSKEDLFQILKKKGFTIEDYKKYNSIEHLYWKFLFKRGYKILNQNSKLNKKEPLIFKIMKELLNQDNFKIYRYSKNIKSKTVYGIKIVLYPFSKIMDSIFINKKQKIVTVKQN